MLERGHSISCYILECATVFWWCGSVSRIDVITGEPACIILYGHWFDISLSLSPSLSLSLSLSLGASSSPPLARPRLPAPRASRYTLSIYVYPYYWWGLYRWQTTTWYFEVWTKMMAIRKVNGFSHRKAPTVIVKSLCKLIVICTLSKRNGRWS